MSIRPSKIAAIVIAVFVEPIAPPRRTDSTSKNTCATKPFQTILHDRSNPDLEISISQVSPVTKLEEPDVQLIVVLSGSTAIVFPLLSTP